MENTDYEVVDFVLPDDCLWFEWKSMVEHEGWTSDDLSVLTLIPRLPSTRFVFARKRAIGSFIACVVWNEYDNIAYIGFYLTVPEYRGKGIGSVIWKHAIERMPKDYIIALRAVPYMIPRYKSRDTPVEGPALHSYEMDGQTLSKVVNKYATTKNFIVKKVNELTRNEYQKLEQFDLSVVKRDRSDFLRRFHELPFTNGSVLFSGDEIVACAAVCPTSCADRHLFKFAPIYASSLQEAITVIEPLVAEVRNLDVKARFLFQLLSGTIGFELLRTPFISMDISSKQVGVTLFSKTFNNPIDIQRLFVAHNNAGHFDA